MAYFYKHAVQYDSIMICKPQNIIAVIGKYNVVSASQILIIKNLFVFLQTDKQKVYEY